MTDAPSFESSEERECGEAFLRRGFVVIPVEDRPALDRIQALVGNAAAKFLGLPLPTDCTGFLDSIHQRVDISRLNDLRLAVIGAVRQAAWFRPAYFSLGRKMLSALAGNELAMQRGIGLNVQIPDDDSSLLPVHADVWDGDSSFEVVQWLPLVDCFATKSMYIVAPEKDRPIQDRLHEFAGASSEDLFRAIEADVEFLTVPYGSVLIFSQTLMHGNRINRETSTRWSMNCRFKSALSPYADKKLGEFFEPITLRPVTRMALRYRLPDGFNE